MNGKKAKLLRKLAGVTKQDTRSYYGVMSTVRNKEVTHPHLLDSAGNPIVLFRYTTVAYALNQGVRLLYKKLKRDYKNKLSNPTASMLSA